MENIQYLEAAQFTKPQGLKGELRARIFCDSPAIFGEIERFYLGESKSFIKIRLCETRKGFAVLKAEGVDNIESAAALVGEIVYINRADYRLPENTWFIRDLIGLTVTDADSGKVYGTVSDILQTAPKDVYAVKTQNGGELLFPAIPEVLIDVDITEGIIKIRPLEGLFSEEA